jgi:uncharacterized protein
MPVDSHGQNPYVLVKYFWTTREVRGAVATNVQLVKDGDAMRSVVCSMIGLLCWIALPCGVQVCSAALLSGTGQEPVRPDSSAEVILKDRRDTEAWLKSSPTSYLATINRVDFAGRTSLTVGRGEGNDLRIDDPEIQMRHLRVTVAGDSFRVEAVDPGAVFLVRKSRSRAATLPPSAIGVGRFLLRLSHQRFPALIAFDPASPRYNEYKGLKYFPVNPEYRFVVPLTRNVRIDTVLILSSRGNMRKGLRVGWFEFSIGGKALRLAVTRLLEPGVGEKDHSIFFRDRTCGEESYAMGRYVEAEELPDGLFSLDFNKAYNPACAFSPHYNCPVPPEENHLPVRIPAGEMDAHYMTH